ncbi:MAG: hypothetical protein R3B54_18065 [Bdellovibrionota bacterium]
MSDKAYGIIILFHLLAGLCAATPVKPSDLKTFHLDNWHYPRNQPELLNFFARGLRAGFNNGFHTLPISTFDDAARAALFLSDGRFVVTGRNSNGSYDDVVVARYWLDGSLDTSFDTDGIAVATFAAGDSHSHALALQGSRIVIAGRRWNGSDFDFGISRFNTDGSPDTTFNGTGHQQVDLGGNDFGRAVGVDGNNRIYVTGFSDAGGSWDYGIVRLLSNGTPDPAFNGNGRLVIGTAGDDFGLGQVVESGNTVTITGSYFNTNDNFVVLRFGTNGAFVGGSQVDVGGGDDIGWAIAQDASQRFLVAGQAVTGTDKDFALARWASDFTFQGSLTTAISTNDDVARAIAITESDEYLLAGNARMATWDFAVARYTNAGALIATFGTGGTITHSIGSGEDLARGLAYQNGKMILVGRSNNGTDLDFAVARLNSTGVLAAAGDGDQHFNVNGIHTVDFNSDTDMAFGLARQTDGKYVLAGFRENGNTASRNFAVVRFNSNGSLDTGFGTGGLQNTDFNGDDDEAQGVAIDSAGRSVVVGFRENGTKTTRNFAIARYRTNGTLDTTFGTGGLVNVDFNGDLDQAYGVAHDFNQRIVVAGFRENGGTNSRDAAIIRLNTNGTLDTSFGTGGRVTLDVSGDDDEWFAVAIDTSNKVLVAGFTENGNTASRDWILARYFTNGVFEGSVTLDLTGGQDEARAVRVDTFGRIVVAGRAANDMGVARYIPTGALDTAFATIGYTTVNTGSTEAAYALALQPNGKIILAGEANNNVLVARLLENGALDTTWAGDGTLTSNPGATDEMWGALVDPDGRIVIGGHSSNNFFIERLWP